ncbi:MAG TPA: hypothetical protein VFS56_02425 [Gemmatimonadaceae bacterium]|nr:hypothetical protein [Gemmatimonadaceae bacterium]
MSELLVKFDEPIAGPDGSKYFAQAAGKETDGGLWEGWLEFLPVDESAEAVRSDRETTQPNRKTLDYWAQGLTVVYLQGALARALAPKTTPRATAQDHTDAARFSAPRQVARPPSSAPFKPRPILDPFAVYAQGEHILRSELGALSRDQVETIATAYGFTPARRQGDGGNPGTGDLVDTVVNGVRSAESR